MPLQIKRPLSHSEAVAASERKLMCDGVRPATIREATEGQSRKGRAQIVLICAVVDDDGNERDLLIYLNDSPLGALMLRSVCEAVGCIEAYTSGKIEAALFPGRRIMAEISTEPRRRNWPARNIITRVMPAEESAAVVPLRAAS